MIDYGVVFTCSREDEYGTKRIKAVFWAIANMMIAFSVLFYKNGLLLFFVFDRCSFGNVLFA